MDPKAIAASYDQLASHWHGDTFNRNNGIAQHERAIAFLKKKRFALDVGCGSSGRFIDLLLGRGFQVDGVDISERMIELARERHPAVTFHCADIRAWELPRAYDFISAWDSIWHVPLVDHEAVLKKLLHGLMPGGICIFTIGGLDSPDERINSFMGPEMYHSTLGIPNTLKVLAESGCICRHLEYDQHPEPHVYIVVQKNESG